jgi:hemolysin activation/secretion protein
MFDDQDVTATTTQFDSNVDLINASDIPVTVTTTVADAMTKKTKRTNLATIVNSLTGLTDEEIDDTKPSVVRALVVQANRVSARYQELLNGSN